MLLRIFSTDKASDNPDKTSDSHFNNSDNFIGVFNIRGSVHVIGKDTKDNNDAKYENHNDNIFGSPFHRSI